MMHILERIFKSTLVAIALFVVAVVFMILVVRAVGGWYSVSSVAHAPKAQAVLILGAGIKSDGSLSSVLHDRAVTALELYQAKKVSKIIVSGNNVSVVHRTDDEVDPVRVFLIKEGVLSQDIFIDHAGVDTYASMYRAKALFNVQSLLITTQKFHLSRAVFIARLLGIQATGVPADKGTYEDRNYIREYMAQPKAFMEVLLRRSAVIESTDVREPITGNGQVTWK